MKREESSLVPGVSEVELLEATLFEVPWITRYCSRSSDDEPSHDSFLNSDD